jgi:putative chitinase
MPEVITKQILTGQILKQIAPSLSIDHANKLADGMAKILPVYGMYNKDVLPEFLAQLAHESIEFSAKTENLNYSAQAILNTWPSRFKTIAEAEPYARNPMRLANKVYNGRMGNAANSNDGWNFRGAGFLQMTGKESFIPYMNFKNAGKGYHFPPPQPATLESMVNLIRTDDEWAIDSACWEFAISKGLIDEAERGDMLTITKKINGGILGYQSRMNYYKKALQVFT